MTKNNEFFHLGLTYMRSERDVVKYRGLSTTIAAHHGSFLNRNVNYKKFLFLQAIKVATESNALGDQMSDHTLSVADDLFHLRIPQLWCDMSGFSAPPLTWGLGQWLAELQSRCHHFERILSLVSFKPTLKTLKSTWDTILYICLTQLF